MITGTLKKLKSDLQDTVNYWLPVGEQDIALNPLIGQSIRLEHTGNIYCLNCQTKTRKSYAQGFCFPCMQKLASCDMCIMKPETCHHHKGTCRDPQWGEDNCMVPHYVYLSNTSGIKVGITRHTQIPIRWIDQGATQAIPIFRVKTRQQSGFVETAFKDLIADKTNWRAMLKGNAEPVDLATRAKQLKEELKTVIGELEQQFGEGSIESLEDESVDISYPVEQFPTKITSHNFDKNPVVEGILQGIKGQYLLLDTGVINIRKFTSYEVNFDDQ
ncbi:DUF2797 domain-containing protein [Pleionea sp. CnH1-48]|uniref:DUF2797 domain-containing protein n=1 Tax=Pleionea sp. CnH1-48 TaxID=2954494 RepID=UPI002097635E|nr:DUF2797 domain-containing protein [Pleionea sp. CnH1-48]MCO7225804.1 DUF2797 domain-containing protein [Pleionea sp. CnH1-48]